MESGSGHPEKALGQRLNASEPFPHALHQQHIYENKSRLLPRQQRQSQRRHSRQSLQILALASSLAILYAVSLCAFRIASNAQPMLARRKMAEGSGADKFGEGRGDSDDSCSYTTLRPHTSPAGDSNSSWSSSGKRHGLEPLEQGPPKKKKKKTFLAETEESEQKPSAPPAPLEETLGPQMESSIDKMLAVKQQLILFDWMIRPDVDLPAEILAEEEEPPPSPKAPSRSPGLQDEQLLEVPLSPGEGTSSTFRHRFQAPPARYAQQQPAGASEGDDLRQSDVWH